MTYSSTPRKKEVTRVCVMTKGKVSPPRGQSPVAGDGNDLAPSQAQHAAPPVSAPFERGSPEDTEKHAPKKKGKNRKGKSGETSPRKLDVSAGATEGASAPPAVEATVSPGTSPETGVGMELAASAVQKTENLRQPKKKGKKSKESPKSKQPLQGGEQVDATLPVQEKIEPHLDGEVSPRGQEHHINAERKPGSRRASPSPQVLSDLASQVEPQLPSATSEHVRHSSPRNSAKLPSAFDSNVRPSSKKANSAAAQSIGEDAAAVAAATALLDKANVAEILQATGSSMRKWNYDELPTSMDGPSSVRNSIVESELVFGSGMRIDSTNFVLGHEVVRINLKSFQTAIEKVVTSLPWQVRSLRKWFSTLIMLLESHHRNVREALVYPWIMAHGQQPPQPKVQWDDISEGLDKTMGMLEELEGLCGSDTVGDGGGRVLGALRRQVDHMTKVIFSFIDEEETMCANIHNSISGLADWASLERSILKSFTHKSQKMLIPWMMQTIDSCRRKEVLRGFAVRLAYRFSWKPKFEKTYLDPLQRVIYEDTSPGDLAEPSWRDRLFRPCSGGASEEDGEVLVL